MTKVLCFMAMVLCVSTAVAVPSPKSPTSKTHRSSHPNQLHHQAPRSHPPHQLSPLSLSPQTPIPTSPILIPPSSGSVATAKKAVAPTASKNASLRSAPTPAESKVEQYAKKLRDDIEAQERVLNVYIATIREKHQKVKLKLQGINVILKGLKDEIANATTYANKYQQESNTEQKRSSIVEAEYEKSRKMYEDEQVNIKFEKEFLDEIIKYIQLRKSVKCN